MKLLWADCCKSLVVPCPTPHESRYCRCGLAACWWIKPSEGILGVWHHWGHDAISIIGLHNGLLLAKCPPGGKIDREQIADILKHTPENYLFSQAQSLVVRFNVGATSDVFFCKEPA